MQTFPIMAAGPNHAETTVIGVADTLRYEAAPRIVNAAGGITTRGGTLTRPAQ